MLPTKDELDPYLVYRVEGAQVECAVWQLKDGPTALALFLSSESATAYQLALGLGTEWKVFRPGARACYSWYKQRSRMGLATPSSIRTWKKRNASSICK